MVFPRSLFHLRRFFSMSEEFTRFVVCKKCYSVYSHNSCVEKQGSTIISRRCSYRTHPNSHNSCQTIFLKTVQLLNGTKRLYPFKTYCYVGFQKALQQFLNRPTFTSLCDHWRNRTTAEGNLQDIYDGNLWKEFQYLEGQSCLAAKYSYAVMINIDWFQPHKLTQSLVEAIYFLNLPYQQRFKRENIILLGIIPGPSEPHRDIDQHLHPLILSRKC